MRYVCKDWYPMKNSKELFTEIIEGIKLQESREEKESIARILMEKICGLGFSQIIANVPIAYSSREGHEFGSAIERLNRGEPVQYIVGEAYFYGNRFMVQEGVLIPRPETEELVDEVLTFIRDRDAGQSGCKIVDIGTGSGCIPITLALKLPQAEVYATDISSVALAIAARNIELHRVGVRLLKHDILQEELPLKNVDVVVSNPPYIAFGEQKEMKPNVLDFEPHLALFVPDEDPLIFYKRIAAEGRKVITNNGMIIFEINEKYGKDITEVLRQNGFSEVKIVKDLSGKNRIVKGIKA
jgi:release factor glutamine methyltransferase